MRHQVLTVLLCCVLGTKFLVFSSISPLERYVGQHAFLNTIVVSLLFLVLLTLWAVLRSNGWLDKYTDYTTQGFVLACARVLFLGTIAVGILLDFTPVALRELVYGRFRTSVSGIASFLVFGITVALLSSWFGRFLLSSQHSQHWRTVILRRGTKVVLVLAAMAVPLSFWYSYLFLTSLIIKEVPIYPDVPAPNSVTWTWIFVLALPVLVAITGFLTANGYSLHGFYRDRLSSGFSF